VEEVKRFVSPDGRRRVIILRRPDGLFSFTVESWSRYYDPSPEDLTAPVDGPGLWGGETSGLYPTAASAEAEARTSVGWLAEM
jgi:hypothetical protein